MIAKASLYGLILISLVQISSDVFGVKPEVDFGLRTRWEAIEVGSQEADAVTLKTRFNIKHNVIENLNVFLQIDGVTSLSNKNHSDGVDQNSLPTIADPDGAELNQLTLVTEWLNTTIILGRQRIVLGDQRFIGDVGFRQNDQTYDAVKFERAYFSGSTLTAAYIYNVNRIFGDNAGHKLSIDDTRYNQLNGKRPDTLLGNHRVEGTLFNFNINEWDHVELSTYLYDIHNHDAEIFSNRTLGIESAYKKKVGHIKLQTVVEFAFQKQPEQEADWIDYQKFSASIKYKKFEWGVRYECFSERNGVAFITPLATLHKFQGWADQFLTTPNVGLVDKSSSFKWHKRPWTIDARYHWFTSDKGSTDIGQELDVDFIFKPNRKHEIKLRTADFNPNKSQTIKPSHVRKLFLMYSYNI